MITGATVQAVGRLLFGDHWRAAFEDCFEISNRSLRRMLNGEIDVPPGLVLEMEQAVREHGMKLDALLEILTIDATADAG